MPRCCVPLTGDLCAPADQASRDLGLEQRADVPDVQELAQRLAATVGCVRACVCNRLCYNC